MRKALGAHRGQLIRQLLSESVLLSVGATVLGVVLTEVLIVLIPVITGSDFQLPYLHWTISTCAGAVALAVGVGLAAGDRTRRGWWRAFSRRLRCAGAAWVVRSCVEA